MLTHTMKNNTLYLIAILCLSLFACSSDDDRPDSIPNVCTPSASPITIIVENEAMSNITGVASINDDRITVNISGDSANDASVFFSCPNAVGTYELSSVGDETQTVTAFVPATTFNIILSTGCFEIVRIDAMEVVMRFGIDDFDTAINGAINLEVF